MKSKFQRILSIILGSLALVLIGALTFFSLIFILAFICALVWKLTFVIFTHLPF